MVLVTVGSLIVKGDPAMLAVYAALVVICKVYVIAAELPPVGVAQSTVKPVELKPLIVTEFGMFGQVSPFPLKGLAVL